MLAQIGQWLELNFWQLAVLALSKTRPLSSRALRATHSIYAHSIETQHSVEVRPLARAFASVRAGNPYAIAISGWLLGLVLGFVISYW
jgi:hypothetical protein